MFGGFNNSSAHWRSLLSPNIQRKNITVKTRGGKTESNLWYVKIDNMLFEQL